MLAIIFINDCTGDELVAHYDYTVRINGRTVAGGKVRGHRRTGGWEGLLRDCVLSLTRPKTTTARVKGDVEP